VKKLKMEIPAQRREYENLTYCRISTRSLLLVASVVALAVSALAFSSAFSVTGQLNNYGPFNETANLEMQQLTLSSGDVIGFHTHPGPAYVIVDKGTLTEDKGCGRITQYAAGSAFQEQAGAVHSVRNAGAEAVSLYVFQIVPLNTDDTTFVPPPKCGD